MKGILEKTKVKEQIVNKWFVLVILLVVGFNANADRKYLVIDSTDTAYTTKHYRLNTQELYNTDFAR